MPRRLLVSTVCLFVMIGNSSCRQDQDGASRIEKQLFAPLTEQEIDELIRDCGSRQELLDRLGTPLRITESNGVEHIEFMVSFDNVQGPTPLMIASFIVIVTNDKIVSWYPRSKGRIR